jgi:hypothetical protein
MTFTIYLKLIKAACNCLGNLEGMNSEGTNDQKNNFRMSGLELDSRDEPMSLKIVFKLKKMLRVN